MVVETRKTTETRGGYIPPDTLLGDDSGPEPEYTFNLLVERFLQAKRKLRPKSQTYYRTHIEGLCYFARLAGWPQNPALITRRHLRDFQDYLETTENLWYGDGRRMTTKKLTPATVFHYLKVAKCFFTWCLDEEYLEETPVRLFKVPEPKYKKVEPYTDNEVMKMLGTCQQDIDMGYRYMGVRNRAIVSIFIDIGIRLDELAGMKMSELDPKLHQVRIMGKGAKQRSLPLNGEARRMLRVYLDRYRQPGGDAVWKTDDGTPLTYEGVKKMIVRLKKRSGLKSDGGPHRFRHYFATRYLENGGDLNTLRLLLGHETLDMVLNYSKFADARRAIRSHAGHSPLDHLYNGSSQQNAERWGYRKHSV